MTTITGVKTHTRIEYMGYCHPNGKPIRFRSMAHALRHHETMRGRSLKHTHTKRMSAQKRRRRRGSK